MQHLQQVDLAQVHSVLQCVCLPEDPNLPTAAANEEDGLHATDLIMILAEDLATWLAMWIEL